MKLMVDSSSFAKRYVREIGSDKLDDLFQHASDLALSVILLPELVAGLNQRLREGVLTARGYRESRKQLLSDVRDATVLQLTPAVMARSVKLLEGNALRAMGAFHIACALEWQADLFITSDKKQFEAALNSGLRCDYL